MFHKLVLAGLVLFGLVGVILFGDFYRAHIWVMIAFWLFLPLVALWLDISRVRRHYQVQALRFWRNALVTAATILSFAAFSNYERIRDDIGTRLVPGYWVSTYEDTDDYGRPYRGTTAHAGTWFGRVFLYLGEWVFLAVCVLVPFTTVAAVNMAIESREREDSVAGHAV